MPLLREEQGITRTVSGLHSTALAVGAIVSGLVFARLAARAGRGPVLAGGLVGMAAGVLLYVSGDLLGLTLLGALICGTCGSIVVNATTPILSDHHDTAAPAAISEGNALATGTGAVAPLLVGAAVAVGLGWRAGVLVTLLGIAGVLLLGRGVHARALQRGPTAASTPSDWSSGVVGAFAVTSRPPTATTASVKVPPRRRPAASGADASARG